MRRKSLSTLASLTIAALLLLTLTTPALAQKTDQQLEAEVVKISQVTGDEALTGQYDILQKDLKHAKRLVASAVKMAKAKTPGLTYSGAVTLAQLAAKLKDYESCEALYRVAMSQAVMLFNSGKILQSYGGLIDTLNEAKKYADVVRVCRELMEIKTGDGDNQVFRFIVEDKFGDFGFEADPDFDLVKPMRYMVYQIMIQAYNRDGKQAQALKLAQNLVRASEGWKERQLLAMVLRDMGKPAEAAKHLEDVLERISRDEALNQKLKETFSDRCRLLLSGVYTEAKQIDKAADLLKTLLERHPDDAGYHNDLGYIWADNGMNLKEAETLIRKALELDKAQRKESPDFNPAEDHDRGGYLDSLGWVLFKQKKYEEAKKYLVEALKDKDAQHIEIYDHLGDTCLALGDRDGALEAWRKGLEVAGDDRLEQERKVEVEKKIQKHK